MIGRLFNTLRYRLNRELREWRKVNRVVRTYAWPWYQKALISAGKRPVAALLCCVLSFLCYLRAYGGIT